MLTAAALSCLPVSRNAANVQQPAAPPAQPIFTLGAIEVSPTAPVAAQPFNVRLMVSNTGSAAGSYMTGLYISGQPSDNSSVFVTPGDSAYLDYTVSIPVPGQYVLSVGPQSREITVAFNRLPSTLKLGSGVSEGCDPIVGSTSQWGHMIQSVDGNLILLTAPAGGFEITSIRIFGAIKSSDYDYNNELSIGGPGSWVYGEDIAGIEPPNTKFTINIYDKRRSKVYTSDYNKDLFTYTPAWVTVPVPGIKVSEDFYIEIVTHNQSKLYGTGFGRTDYWNRYIVHTWYYQLCIGFEYAPTVQSWVSQNGQVEPERYLTFNWLIQAIGNELR